MLPRILRFIIPCLLACLPLQQAALADKSTDFSNIAGALSGSNAGLSLTGSTQDAVATAAMTAAYGAKGVADGVLFSGAFSGPVTWTLTTFANGTHNYTLTAVVTGVMGSTSAQGVTVQMTVNTGKGFFNGSTSTVGGETTAVSFVPEPSTLTMLGTGLLVIGGGIRRRLAV